MTAADQVPHTTGGRLCRGWYTLGEVARHQKAQGSLGPLAVRHTDAHVTTRCISGLAYEGQPRAPAADCRVDRGSAAGTWKGRSHQRGGGGGTSKQI